MPYLKDNECQPHLNLHQPAIANDDPQNLTPEGIRALLRTISAPVSPSMRPDDTAKAVQQKRRTSSSLSSSPLRNSRNKP